MYSIFNVHKSYARPASQRIGELRTAIVDLLESVLSAHIVVGLDDAGDVAASTSHLFMRHLNDVQ
jgi:phage gp36-like protein